MFLNRSTSGKILNRKSNQLFENNTVNREKTGESKHAAINPKRVDFREMKTG